MSTISVALSERLTALHGEKRQIYATATVFGRPEAAAAGKLFVVAAGPAQAIEKCQILFDAMGQKTFVLSEKPADANLVKLSGNFLIAATIESLWGSGRACPQIRNRRASLCRNSDWHPLLRTSLQYLWRDHCWRKLRPGRFKMALGLKDIKLALAAAETLNVPLPIASLVRDHFLSGLAQGQGDSDWAALARIAAKNSGL